MRTVPQKVDQDAEYLWDVAKRLHPDWEHITWRDPIDPAGFPITSPYWNDCQTGAQLADLVRAEDLYHRGGVYIDADVWCLRPFDSLCRLDGFAAWEDVLHIPNAVLGFTPGHQALQHVLDMAIAKRFSGTWAAGVGVTTQVFRSRDDMTLLPPGSFYPVHWRTAHTGMVNWDDEARTNPWAFCIHKYKASWHAP